MLHAVFLPPPNYVFHGAAVSFLAGDAAEAAKLRGVDGVWSAEPVNRKASAGLNGWGGVLGKKIG